MHTTLIRSNGADLVDFAQKALAAQKAHPAQKAQKSTNDPKFAIADHRAVLADLHNLVGIVQERREAAIGALVAHVDKPGESPIEVYTTLKCSKAFNLPSFAQWVRGGTK